MTQPPEDMTETDALVEPTDNGPHEGDPDEQPPQDPGWIPPGSATDRQDSGR